MTIKQFFAGFRKKAMSFGRMIFTNNPAMYIEWNRREEYLKSDAVYSIVQTIATKAASVPLYVYKPKADATKYFRMTKSGAAFGRMYQERVKALGEIVADNELSRLLMNPNPSQGADAFYVGVFSFYKLFGECFIWLNRGGIEGGKVLEMYLIPPHMVTILPDPMDLYGVAAYRFDLSGQVVDVPKEQVLHWKNFNPQFDAINRTHLRGFSPLVPGSKRVQMDSDATDATVAMYQNGGARGALTNEMLSDLTPEQEGDLRGLINGRANGTAVKSMVATLPGKWQYLDMGLSSVDMQLLLGQEMTMKRLCALFGCPYELFQSDTTFANKEMAMKSLITNTIMPMCYSFRDELNRVLSDGKTYADFDFSTLPEMQDDMSKIVAAAKDSWWITPNEKRELTGYDPLKDAAMDRIYVPTGIEDISNLTMPDE